MKKGFYAHLARDGIRKNKKLYIPYILTCIGMVLMFYIIAALCYSPMLENMRGGADAKFSLLLGRWVIGVFSVFFLFYTNSFLIRRRKKEFGLYNILGMGKRNISYIILWESLYTAAISLAVGLFCGIVLFKFAELGLFNAIKADINYSLLISFEAVIQTAVLFASIFALLLLSTLLQVRRYKPITLLQSENIGEKPPKANRVLAILGFIILALAYYIAVTIKDPLSVLIMFFAAVIMVIVSTYLLFISGSVVFCRILQKNKNYYYKTRHFISISSMVYRMKRNGAGLASICILSTMVLVMISSTSSLYIGTEDNIRSIYPRNITVDIEVNEIERLHEHNINIYKEIIDFAVKNNDAKIKNTIQYRAASILCKYNDGKLQSAANDPHDNNNIKYNEIYQVYIIPLNDYNKVMNTKETLRQDEVLVYNPKHDYKNDYVMIENTEPLKIKKFLTEFENIDESYFAAYSSIFIITADFDNYITPLMRPYDSYGSVAARLGWFCGFDTNEKSEIQIKIKDDIASALRNMIVEQKYGMGYNCGSAAEQSSSFYATYGGLFFLGIVLSIVFIFAAALIIYYKQISEGYEDRSRFEIMQKVGMTKKDIRKSINSQILTVFFAPLIFAGLHLAFAFPLVWKILQLFNLKNLSLLIIVSVCCFFAFALLYTFVYRITSNVYYRIVSDAKKI